MNVDTVLTLTQALQLVGLAPSLMLVVFLLLRARHSAQAVVPAFYFLALACSFAVPLITLHPMFLSHSSPLLVLLIGENMLVSLSFLLICQFAQGRVPPASYYWVLAIPAISSASLIYDWQSGACPNLVQCALQDSARVAYHVVTSSLMFLLLLYFSSKPPGAQDTPEHRRHKYSLVIALILLHLMMLSAELAALAGVLPQEKMLFTTTIFRLSFIYLVLTSLFRVFYPALASQPAPESLHDPALDAPYVARVRALLEEERLYRSMRLSRAALADKIGIGEHQLSRIINHYFSKNFNELINHYRIEEAKARLSNEPTQITVIAFEVGFNSIASFNRVFKEKTGVSPSEFRAKHLRTA